MIQVVIDSGSTKADWAIIEGDGGQIHKFTTHGFNPTRQKQFPLISISNKHALLLKEATQVHLYGAGICDDLTEARVKVFIAQYVNRNCKIKAQNDLLGAAKATAGDNEGIIGILGTGSNTGLYNGYIFEEQVPTLGYLISDEGGGTQLGKQVLRSYFYDEMPNHVRERFILEYSPNKSQILENLYQKQFPSTFIASFTNFLNLCNDASWRWSILEKEFHRFVDIRIKKYENYKALDVHMVGSVAFHFQTELRRVMKNENIKLKTILKKPIDGLIAYHEKSII